MSFLKTQKLTANSTNINAASTTTSPTSELETSHYPDFKIIETILAKNNCFVFKKEHFSRMHNTAQHFGFVFPEELSYITPEKDGLVRILLNKDGSFTIEYKELHTKPIFDSLCSVPYNSPKKIEISQFSTDSTNVFLYHKTTSRKWYNNAYERIKSGCVYDVIFFNEKEELTEGARSNILLEIDETLYTPPIHCGLLNGVMRQKLLNEKKCVERVLYRKDIEKAQKIFCINSVRGIQEVRL